MYIIWNMFVTSRLPYSSSYALHVELNTCFTILNGIYLNKILVAMENFERCTVAILGGPCSQHVTDNTSRLNQPQSAIIAAIAQRHVVMFPPYKKYLYSSARCKGESLLATLNSLLCLGVPFSWYQSVFDVCTLGNQNAQLLSERPIHEKRNVQLTTFWSKWRKKQSGVLVWCWITNIYWGIYGDNHAHGTRKHFGKGLVTGRQDSRHTVFLVVCTTNATICFRHIC